MDTVIQKLNALLNRRAVNDATNDQVVAVLLADGKDEDTARAAIAQLEAHNITRLQFLQVFGYA